MTLFHRSIALITLFTLVAATAVACARRRDEPPPARAIVDAPTSTASSGKPGATLWDFEFDDVDASPNGFTFGGSGGGAPGRFRVVEGGFGDRSKRALSQLDTDATRSRVSLAIARGVPMRDVDLRVRCRMVSGVVARACGLVFRLQDDQNFYLAVVDATAGAIRLDAIEKGVRTPIGLSKTEVRGDGWHTLRVVAAFHRLIVEWDGAQSVDATDTTFIDAGNSGVATIADAVTTFDDLTVGTP